MLAVTALRLNGVRLNGVCPMDMEELKVYQNWEESLRVSEKNMQDIQRTLRCRVCARWGHMYSMLLTFNILAT